MSDNENENVTNNEPRKRAMTSEKASEVKKQGHEDEKEFAKLIGMESEYQNGPTDKKDVVDKNGDTHSLKGGNKRWQIFLYSPDRFKKDYIFKVMGGTGDGIGKLLLACLDCFPDEYSVYQADKAKYKNLLKYKMIELSGKLQNDEVFAAFLHKSIFNCGEVTYLTIKNDDIFHVFLNDDVIDTLIKNLTRETSIAKQQNQMDYQKVTFVYNSINVGTIEIRHDSDVHYRQAVFSLDKKPILDLLISNAAKKEAWGSSVIVYGKAIKKFQKNHKSILISK